MDTYSDADLKALMGHLMEDHSFAGGSLGETYERGFAYLRGLHDGMHADTGATEGELR